MKQSIWGMMLLFVSTASLSAKNPASTTYVDQQIAKAKASLLALINANSVAHPVGSCYGGGVVIYVNTAPGTPAQHQGLIAALTDASANPLEWDTTGNTPVITAAQYFTGRANTAVMAIPPSGIFQAAEAAVAYNAVVTKTCSTCTDWYLPSQDELMAMYTQSNSSNPTFWTNCSGMSPTAAIYWSSTQVNGDSTKAWSVDFTVNTRFSGNVVSPPGGTTTTQLVRAIRAF